MTSFRAGRAAVLAFAAALSAAASVVFSPAAVAQSPTTFDASVPSGDNYDRAEFRLWLPPSGEPPRAIVVLVPGSGDDGRPEVEDSVWRAFATHHRVTLLGCYFTDKPHEQDFIEEYADVGRGSGQALLTALTSLAAQAGRPELANAPLLLWGISAGGEFNYEFAAWKPERVAAFVVNKGGIYYSALVPKATRDVPGLFFIGGKDLAFRTNTIVGLFAVNRRAGALWALAEESEAGHEVGRSREMAMIFFEEALTRRLEGTTLRPMDTDSGFVGDLEAKTFQPAPDAGTPGVPTAWLPGPRSARAWRALVTGQPFDP